MSNLPYLQAVSLETQIIEEAETPQVLLIDTIDDVNQFSVDTATGVITYNKRGTSRKFTYIIAPQVARVGNCLNEVPNFKVWLQKKSEDDKEFTDVEHSTVLIDVNRHRTTKDVLVLSGLITLEEGDQLRIMMASNYANEVQIEYTEEEDKPSIASAIITIFNIGLEKDEDTSESETATEESNIEGGL